MLTPRDTQICRLTARGYDRGEVAVRTNVSAKTVQRVLKQPEAQALVRKIQEQVDPSAVEVLRELLSSPSDSIRLSAARALLQTPLPYDDPETDADERPRITVHVPRDADA